MSGSSPIPSQLKDWAMNHSNVGCWLYDIQKKDMTWSDQCLRIFSQDQAQDFSNEDELSNINHNDRRKLIEKFQRCIESGESFDIQLSIKNETNGFKEVRLIGKRIDDKESELRIEGLAQDITNFSKLKRDINSANFKFKEYADLLDTTTIVAQTDLKGLITHVNNKFCEISKYPEAELLGKNHRILNSGFHPKEFFVTMWKTITSGKNWQGQIKNKAKDGSFYWVHTIIHPTKNEDGTITSYLSVRRDITKEKEKQAVDIRSARLMTVGEVSSQIMHDVMNPLALIHGYAYRLRKIKLDDEKKSEVANVANSIDQSVDKIQKIFQEMRAMLNDDVHMNALNLDSLISDALDILNSKIEKRQIEVKLNLSSEAIIGNRTLLVQVFTNIIKNAIEAISELGNPWIEIKITSVGRFSFVRVTDSGHGIPEHVQEHMFDSFYTTKDKQGGTGIGLALCHKIVTLHGGNIEVNQKSKHTEIDIIFPKVELEK